MNHVKSGLQMAAALILASAFVAEAQETPASPDRVTVQPGSGRAFAPGTSFRDCENCPQMTIVPAGRFVMGSPASEAARRSDEGPQRQVTIASPFAVSTFEVTWDEWEACVADGQCSTDAQSGEGGDEGWGRARHPVINVSRDDAVDYVRWLSASTGQAYRLLSEAEWEYAARGGTQTAYSWGDQPPVCDPGAPNLAQFDNDADCEPTGTAPVGASAANGFGLHDMHGNVYEWVADCYRADYSGAPADGSAVVSRPCTGGVFRGASWGSAPQLLRSAFRFTSAPEARGDFLGFRVARELLLFGPVPERLRVPREVLQSEDNQLRGVTGSGEPLN